MSCDSSCNCGAARESSAAARGQAALARRDFMKLLGLGSLAALCPGLPAIAGPFTAAEFAKLIPADKKLRPDWLASLRLRGTPTVYRGAELATIGMPIGGIGTGQLYLGGDGRLWHWDIFNLPQAANFISAAGPNYATPPAPDFPIEQGFAIRVGDTTRMLDVRGFDPRHISFQGAYPMAFVRYKDPALPVTIALEAFTPYCPLNVPDSSLPATVMHFTVTNTSAAPVTVTLTGWLENGANLASGKPGMGVRRNRVSRAQDVTLLHCTAEPPLAAVGDTARPDIVFEDFEKGYDQWQASVPAVGTQPARGTLPGQQPVTGFAGAGLVNTFLGGDAPTGTLLSKPFAIERRFITFLIGGGSAKEQTCINLLVAGAVVRTATGRDIETLTPDFWDVADLQGKQAQLHIVDTAPGPWGHINCDQIVFTDQAPAGARLDTQADAGAMALALLGPAPDAFGAARCAPGAVSSPPHGTPAAADDTTAPFGEQLIGGLGRTLTLAPGASADATFVVTWFFPGLLASYLCNLTEFVALRRDYANRFDCAAAVAYHVAENFSRLAGQTKLWHETWYDSSLPYWFLDRTFASICTLATSTCFIFNTGRFYAFEGVYCCGGTCQHVWNYAQAVGRIFPALERDLRQRTDFGTAWHANGAIDYRGEVARHVAHDGQCGVILRAYREHLTAPDDCYLQTCWPRIKQSILYLIGQPGGAHGILRGEQYNTLDAAWFGPMAWISSLYIACLRAGEAMAREMGDTAFAARCAQIAERGSERLVRNLYNGDYFIHKSDPQHPDSPRTGDGCHIDQLMGQAWALQVGLGRVVPLKESGSALSALWRYNFTPDVGPYRDHSPIAGGRWYAMPGEGGVIMTTFPHGAVDASLGKAFGYYFNEVWTGQEHQLAAHMLWEGMLDHGLAIIRVIHDRHHAARRNPYNEVECSDHYARAMSSYGSFIAICGFEYHGPRGHIAFAPRLTPDNFKAAFTAAEGWGTFTTTKTACTIAVRWGSVMLKTIALARAHAPAGVRVTLDGKPLPAQHTCADGRLLITLHKPVHIPAGAALTITCA
jgi:uncharacterized protein (DUF608 family)